MDCLRGRLTRRGSLWALTLAGGAVLFAGCGPATANDGAEAKAGPATPSDTPPSSPDRANALTGQRVEVAELTFSAQSLSIDVPGQVEGNRDATLAAALGGFIESVRVKENQSVREGQLLLAVDAEMHALRLARARVEWDSATREVKRTESMAGAIPQAELDSARDRQLVAAAALRELELNAKRAEVRAPFAGVVVQLDAEVGEVASPGAPLLRLVQLEPIHVSVSLSDRDRPLAEVGSAAVVQLEAIPGLFEGKVTRLSSVSDPSTRAFEAIVELPNPKRRLLPGMLARVSLQSHPEGESTTEQLVISQDWLVTKLDGVGVFVLEDGKAAWRPVKLGGIVRKQVVVTSGLSAGDEIVIAGHRDLQEGDELLVQRRGKCCVAGRATF